MGSQPLTVIQGNDVKAIEKLALIFMNPFHLDIEEGVGVDVDFVFSLEVCRELQLVFLKIEETEGSPMGFQFQKPPWSPIVLYSGPGKQMTGSSPVTASLNPCTKADTVDVCSILSISLL